MVIKVTYIDIDLGYGSARDIDMVLGNILGSLNIMAMGDSTGTSNWHGTSKGMSMVPQYGYRWVLWNISLRCFTFIYAGVYVF